MSLPLAYAELEAGFDARKSDFVRFDTCMSCTKERPATWMLKSKCSHMYCAGYVSVLFKQAMMDEQLFLPRCCKEPLPRTEAKRFLGQQLSARFDEKALVRHTTGPTVRTGIVVPSYDPTV